MQNTVATTNNDIDNNKSGRRPYLSLNGPNKSCPAARPIMLNVSPSWTIGIVVRKSPVMLGNAGRYMSVTNGANAVNAPKNT